MTMGSPRSNRVSDLVAHGGHVLASNLSTFDLANEQTNGIILTDDQDEGIAYTTELDPRSRYVAISVLDSLAFTTIYDMLSDSNAVLNVGLTRFQYSYHIGNIEHHMDNGGPMEEWCGTYSRPRYSRCDLNFALTIPRCNLYRTF